jgi:hypothetical protein
VGVQLWQLLLTKGLYVLLVNLDAKKTIREHSLEALLFHQAAKKPEGCDFACVVNQSGDNKVHSLDVAHALFVISKCNEYSLHAALDFLSSEILRVLKRSLKVNLDVLFKLHVRMRV